MYYYYFFSLVLTGGLLFSKDKIIFILYLGCIYFLWVLPDTGFDYGAYKLTYDNAYFKEQFPWFASRTYLTSEPLYIWYTSAIGVIFPFDFRFFLQFNFTLCGLILFSSSWSTKRNSAVFFWVAFLPVVIPTVFYFSPRSSISFFLILAGFSSIVQDRRIIGYLLCFLGISIHSQYIPVTFFLIIISLLDDGKRFFSSQKSRNTYYKINVFLFLSLFFISMLFAGSLVSYFSAVLDVLPSGQVASNKLHYIEEAAEGYRITSVLSIIIFPFLMYKIKSEKEKNNALTIIFKKQKHDIKFLNYLFLIIIFGALLNIIFFNTPHVAGRLSRFSDYLGIGLVVPSYFIYFYGRNSAILVLFLFALMAPILYPTLYVAA